MCRSNPCFQTATTSAPGPASALPHRHRDWPHLEFNWRFCALAARGDHLHRRCRHFCTPYRAHMPCPTDPCPPHLALSLEPHILMHAKQNQRHTPARRRTLTHTNALSHTVYSFQVRRQALLTLRSIPLHTLEPYPPSATHPPLWHTVAPLTKAVTIVRCVAPAASVRPCVCVCVCVRV